MIARIQLRRDTSEQWELSNPILSLGEIGYETDTNKFKIGINDSEELSRWNSLPYQLGQWLSDSSGNLTYGYQSGEGNVSIKNDLFVGGDFTVMGTTTTINTQNSVFKDEMIELNQSVGVYTLSLQKRYFNGIEIDWSGYEFYVDDLVEQTYGPFTTKGKVVSWTIVDDLGQLVVEPENQEPFTSTETITSVAGNEYVISEISYELNSTIYNPNLESGIQVNRGLVDEVQSFQKLYWDEVSSKWVIDSDLNVLGDIYSNGNVLWRLNGDGEIYYLGNVGIGTSSPSAKLEVESPSGAGNTNLFRLIRDGGYGDTTFNQWYTDGAGTPSGSNPTALYGLNMGLNVGSANNGKVAVRLESQAGSNTIDDSIVFRTANSDKVFIKSSGNVGIGTSSPGYQLEVDSEVHGQISVQGETTAQLLLGNESGPEKGRLIYRHSNDSFAIDVNSVERMTIDSSGKVGIGTSSPSGVYKLSVENTSGGSIGILSKTSDSNSASLKVENSTGSTSLFEYQNKFTVRKNSTDAVVIGSTGKVGIGTTNLSEKLDVDGNIKVYGGMISLDSNWNVWLDGSSGTSFQINDTTGVNTTFEYGNVGIGYSAIIATDEKLQVNGAIKIGTTTTNNAGTIKYESNDFLGYNGTDWISFTAAASGKWSDGTTSGDIHYSSGNVGIGTSSPDAPLTVITSNDTQSGGIILRSSSTGGRTLKLWATGDKAHIDAGGGNVDLILNNAGGNVGIGTSSPQGTLNIKGSAASLVLSDDDTASDVAAKLSVDGGRGKLELFRNGASYKTMLWDSGSKTILDNTAGADLVLQSSGGNVGIGTSEPSAKLEVESPSGAGNTNLFRLIRDGGYGDTTFNQWYTDGAGTPSGSNPTALYGLNMGLNVGSANNGKVAVRLESQAGSNTIDDSIVFRTANSDKVFIKSSGNVGIGTSSPYSSLTVRGTGNLINLDLNSTTTGSNSSIVWNGSTSDSTPNYSVAITGYREGTGAAGALGFKTRNGTSGNLEERMIIDSTGKVGIGTTSPSEKLHVDGDSFIDGVLKLSPKEISKILTASDGGNFDWFGSSVALSSDGSVLAVGASGWDADDIFNQGDVYIYDWSGNSWVQRGNVLTAPEGTDPVSAGEFDNFGRSVALSSDGSVLVVGASGWDADDTSNNQGAVYIYDWSGNSWVQRGNVLTAPEGTDPVSASASDNFGISVALSSDGSVLVVGASGWDADGTTNNQGAVYIYDKSGDTWTLRGNVLTAPEGTGPVSVSTSDYFGSSVALSSDGSVLAVGATRWDADGTTNNQGAVYIYDLDKTNDDRTLRGLSVLTAPEGTDPVSASASDYFGISVALSSDGSVLAVGATGWDADGTTNNQGAVYIYDKSGDTWTLRGSSVLTASDAVVFGSGVALSSDGSVLVVGDNYWSGIFTDQGAVYTYSLEANSFPLSVSDKGYGLNVINDNIILNSDVEVTGSIFEGGTSLSAKYAPIDIETGKWDDGTTSGDIYYNSGRVGIGTNDPVLNLHIHNSGTTSDDHSYVHFTTGDTGSSASDGFSIGYTASNSALIANRENTHLYISTNNQTRMTILKDGRVGIGTTTPSEKLHVDGAIILASTTNNNPGTIKYESNDFLGYNGTEWKSLTTTTENFTDLKDTPRDFTKSVVGDLLAYPSTYGNSSLVGSPQTIVGDTRDGREIFVTPETLYIWDGDDFTYYEMPNNSDYADWKYPDESWILVTFDDDNLEVNGSSPLKTRRISKIILTTGPSSSSYQAGYTFGVFGIINSTSIYGSLSYSFDETTGKLEMSPYATGVPAGEGVRKEILRGTVFGNTVTVTEEGTPVSYRPPDYRIGTGYPQKCVWKLDTPVEAQHLEFRLSRYISSLTSNLIGGIEIFDDMDNKYVVRLNSDGTALELSDDHETRINSIDDRVTSIDDRVTSIDDRVTAVETSILIPLPQWTMTLNTTICPRIQYYNTTTDSNYYELNYDIFYSTLSPNPIPNRAILYARVHTGATQSWGASFFGMTGYDRVLYSTSSTLNPPLEDYEEYIVSTQGIQNTYSYIDWSGYLFPTWGNPDGTPNPSPSYRGRIGLTPENPRKLAIRWSGNLYMTVLGYMMPNYTD